MQTRLNESEQWKILRPRGMCIRRNSITYSIGLWMSPVISINPRQSSPISTLHVCGTKLSSSIMIHSSPKHLQKTQHVLLMKHICREICDVRR